MDPSDRGLRPFLAMEVMERALAMERAGTRVLHLELGEPDAPPPPAAVEAARRALGANRTHYTDSRGLAELRIAIARDKGGRARVEIDPERVIVTGGTSPGLSLVFAMLLAPGDEVVLPAPHYPCYPNFARLFGGVPVAVPGDPDRGFRVDPDAVARAIGPRTRAIVLGSPANPTGAIQDAETLRALAALGPALVCDEIYDGLVYEGGFAPSALAASPDAIVVDGFSKRYAMTGFRLGYVVAPPRAVRTLQILHQTVAISASEFVQHAGIAALAHGEPTCRAMRETYRARRDQLVDGLRRLGFGVAQAPPGAFYVLADARRFTHDSLAFAGDLLERAHVAVTPGIDFGESAEGFLRFSYATSQEVIREALVRLEGALAAAGR